MVLQKISLELCSNMFYQSMKAPPMLRDVQVCLSMSRSSTAPGLQRICQASSTTWLTPCWALLASLLRWGLGRERQEALCHLLWSLGENIWMLKMLWREPFWHAANILMAATKIWALLFLPVNLWRPTVASCVHCLWPWRLWQTTAPSGQWSPSSIISRSYVRRWTLALLFLGATGMRMLVVLLCRLAGGEEAPTTAGPLQRICWISLGPRTQSLTFRFYVAALMRKNQRHV